MVGRSPTELLGYFEVPFAGKTLATDGPFAETKEQLGGFYLIECDNLDQAIDAASRIPAARGGTIEVRPIADLPDA